MRGTCRRWSHLVHAKSVAHLVKLREEVVQHAAQLLGGDDGAEPGRWVGVWGGGSRALRQWGIRGKWGREKRSCSMPHNSSGGTMEPSLRGGGEGGAGALGEAHDARIGNEASDRPKPKERWGGEWGAAHDGHIGNEWKRSTDAEKEKGRGYALGEAHDVGLQDVDDGEGPRHERLRLARVHRRRRRA